MPEESLDFQQYQDAALRTCGVPAMLNVVLGLNGEAGEVADLYKKAMFQGHNINTEKVIDELGDILWYIAIGASCLGTSLEAVAARNVAKLRARYPEGFNADRSVCRD